VSYFDDHYDYFALLHISDTLTINYESEGNPEPVGLIKTDIAWTTDKRSKYGNPNGFDTDMRGGNVNEFHFIV